MEKITFVIPARNNLEFLQLAYKSIRDLQTVHEILILDDASTDGTNDWINSLKDTDLITYRNIGSERIGIVGMFDKGIEMARTDIIFAFHADMVAAPNLDVNILKHLQPGTVVSATRIEPPLHPRGPEKITMPWGNEIHEYQYDLCKSKFQELEVCYQNEKTEGIFAPWCMYRKDYLAIGGHDELFAPQSKEDSDLFNRFLLKGYKLVQSWDGLVYHFTSRGSRFNKHSGGAAGIDSPEWQFTTQKNARNFIRKWGHFVKHDSLMKPIVPHKYNVAFVVRNCSEEFLGILEPWCDRIYVDNKFSYIESEQPNTKFDLTKRVLYINENNPDLENDIVLEFNGKDFRQSSFNVIQNLSEILTDSGEIGTFELDCFKFTINQLTTYENTLIHIKN
jgi:glycosyltransferase involved in cell wall biosynthesis